MFIAVAESVIPNRECDGGFCWEMDSGVLAVDVVEVAGEGGRLDCDFSAIRWVIDLPVGQSA